MSYVSVSERQRKQAIAKAITCISVFPLYDGTSELGSLVVALVQYILIETIRNFNLKALLWLYTKVQFHGNLHLSITRS